MEVADYDFHFNLQYFKDELQTMDLENWKVKLSKEREIKNEVTKIVELEGKRRTYVHELHDNIAETMQQGVHGTVQSSFTCKDKRSHRGEYKAEIKRS